MHNDRWGTARALAQAGADLIALEELTPDALPVYEAALASGHPHHVVVGTVGLWSRYPLADSRPVDIRPGEVRGDWSRGVRSTVRTPSGDVAVYVAHLPSVRIRLPDGFGTGWRDESAAALGAAIAAEDLDRIVLLGDFNSTLDDRGLAPVTSRMTPAEEGFGFSWPAGFPIARIDHVMTRAATPVATWTLPATGSDHLAVAARVKL
ncbi:endonuclease/exonuclease/phosphatase family protein [Nonomuraea sp. NPDC049695]|uniref:endonuclease/exonuclease/phosphatase family protein n=1 Tax=Nonomuraea sp. NPDC049695 TaxID=3154734 RepID=UPI0034155109